VGRQAIDDEVVAVVSELARPVGFREIADVLVARGATRSQVHNAVYRLGKKGRLRKESRSGAGMTYTVAKMTAAVAPNS
jgi:hypothetical protein